MVNLLGLPLEDRPAFFTGLLARLQELRAQNGRPHWLVADEAHHLMPAAWQSVSPVVPPAWPGLLLITVHPDQVAPAVLAAVDLVIAVGAAPERTLAAYSEALGEPSPSLASVALEPGEALVWPRRNTSQPFRLRSAPGRTERHRHPNASTSRANSGRTRASTSEDQECPQPAGPEPGPLPATLRGRYATWLYHLRQEDYSRWFHDAIGDAELAAEVAQIEIHADDSPGDSRARIRAAIAQRYTLPAASALTGGAGGGPSPRTWR